MRKKGDDTEQVHLRSIMKEPDLSRPIHQIMPFVFGALALFFGICFLFAESGALVGDALRIGFFGLFGRLSASFIPLGLLFFAFFWRQSVRRHCIISRAVSVFLMLTLFSMLVYTVPTDGDVIRDFDLIGSFKEGDSIASGGAIGNTLAFIFVSLIDKIGTYIVATLCMIAFAVVCFGFTPSVIAARIRDKAAKRAEERIRDRRELREEKENLKTELRRHKQEQKKAEQKEKIAVQAREQRERYAEKQTQKKAREEKRDEAKQQSRAIDIDKKETQAKARRDRFKEGFDIDIDDGTAEDVAEATESAVRKDEGGTITSIPAKEVLHGTALTSDAPMATAEEKPRPTFHVNIGGVSQKQQEPPPAETLPFDLEKVTERVEITRAEQETAASAPVMGKEAPRAKTESTGRSAPRAATYRKTPDAPLVTPDMISTKTHIDTSDKPVGEVPEEEDAEEKRRKEIEESFANYAFPPFTLLNQSKETDTSNITEEINANAEKLVETLTSFNVRTHITSVSRGPRITRYELVPEAGVRIRSIANLIDDISMNLASAGIRIEAPIPGKSAVGIEVPNKISSTVALRELLENDAFKNAAAPTTVCVGADVTGEPVYGDLAKMPHTLIAGATGMGKSVCINTIITSILYKARPDEVKLILVDPKKVELGVYNGIPHLLVPVVIDPKKATGALSWAVCEMERRFDLIEEAGVRDLKGYNKTLEEHPEREKLPHIIIVIDELNDLMMVASDSVEASICRIAQKARAAGIHLIIGTQRPSVDVITGTIKANIPSRIAFHVASQIDSRTILDTAGAEKLLNNGDMLYYPVGVSKPLRVQGAFISDGEVEKVTSFLKENSLPDTYSRSIMEDIEREAEKCSMGKKAAAADSAASSDGDGDEDFTNPKFREAVELAIDEGKISTSLIQRRLKLGFGKAARFIDIMQRKGIVSEPDGQKPRTTLITRDQFYDMLNHMNDRQG